MSNISDIECGYEHLNGERLYRVRLLFFGNKPVEVFTATKDARKRWLVKASLLAAALGVSSNSMAMYLGRRRHDPDDQGIFLAESYKYRGPGRKDLKVRCFFVSVEFCYAYARYCRKQGL